MKFYRLLVLLLVLFPFCTFAQSPFCGSDELRSKLITEDARVLNMEQQMHENAYRSIKQNEFLKSSGGTIIIPVVFHIMHNNGPENVQDSVILNSLNELNLRFQNAAPYFDSTGNNINIQFCLATVDPQGNPTTGITRDVTSYTIISLSTDDLNMKNINRWSPFLYCNIWVVNKISGNVAGYSTLPHSAGTAVDGIVIEADYLTNSYVLAHELGHYCGLAHTFSYTCSNFNCLLEGDQVCDTPPDTSQLGFPCMWNSCSTDIQDTTGLSPFVADVNELPNYMDYTSCPVSFTQGQGERMEILVNLYRSLLFTSNGCGANPGQAAPVAGFNFNVSSCNDGVVSFSDSVGTNVITSEWDFNGDSIYEFLGNDFSFTFPASGTYLVTQRVTSLGGQDSTSQSITVMKGTTFNYPIVTPGTAMDTMLICAGDSITFSGDPAGATFLWSTGATTQSITITTSTTLDISLTMTDANGFIWNTQCTPIHLIAYPNNKPEIDYTDTTGYICANELLSLYITNPIPGLYTWQVYNQGLGWFNTGDHNLSYNYYPDPVNGNQFVVTYTNTAGCDQVSDTLTVQPQAIPFLNGVPLFVNGNLLYYNSTGFQYQWYNYNIPIPGATTNQYTVTSTGCYQLKAWNSQYPECDAYTDTVCFEFTGMNEFDDNFTIYPNPASDLIVIDGLQNYDGNLSYKICNMLGQELIPETLVTDKSTLKINCSFWNDGIYFLQIDDGNSKLRKKIVVARE